MSLLLATINYAQTVPAPTGSTIAEPTAQNYAPISNAGAGTTAVQYSLGTAIDQGGVSTIERAAALGLVPPGTSTSAAGWIGPAPINTPVVPAELVGPGQAPYAGVDRTPFLKRMTQRLWLQIAPPAKNEWADESKGLHADFPGPTASTPNGMAQPGTSQRGNTWRLQPQPWDADTWIGQGGQGIGQ